MLAGVAPTLPGIIGAQLAQPLAAMQAVLAKLERNPAVPAIQRAALGRAIASAHEIALKSQQISRLAGGRLRQSHERLRLDQLLADALDARSDGFRQAGRQVRRKIKPVEVIVDPGLLWSLLETAIGWAEGEGTQIQVSLDIKNWPEHGMLVLRAAHPALDAQGEALSVETIDWHLLQQIGQAMGLLVERSAEGGHSIVTIEFPRTVKQLEGLTAVEMNVGGGDSSFLGESRPLAGHRVLLVTADEYIRAEVKNACDALGLVMDTTPTTERAIRLCELDKPHMIVVDERLRDEAFDALREDLLRIDINFPMVEIASDANTFEMSSWMGDSISRIGRDALRSQLSSILVMELAKVT